MTKKYHLEVWLGAWCDPSQLELQFFPAPGPLGNASYNAIELVDIRYPNRVILGNTNVLVNGRSIPTEYGFNDAYRAAFYVRDGVTVDDFEVTIIQPY